jgi:hypothetical protein
LITSMREYDTIGSARAVNEAGLTRYDT